MQQLIDHLSAEPIVCVILSAFLFSFASLTNYLLLDALLKMHRSKSAVKKLKKEYSFLQKMWLLHFKENCCHAVKFCGGMIIYQKIAWVCFAIYLVIAVFFVFDLISATWISWFAVGSVLVFDMPVFVINRLLARPVLFGRFKAFSFEKYHNTDNHESLL